MQPAAWETAVNWAFVQRLQQRQHRPGLLDRRYARQIAARHTGMGTSLSLAQKLNRRWQPLGEELDTPVPIVYAAPMPSIHSVENHLVNQTVVLTPTSPASPAPLPVVVIEKDVIRASGTAGPQNEKLAVAKATAVSPAKTSPAPSLPLVVVRPHVTAGTGHKRHKSARPLQPSTAPEAQPSPPEKQATTVGEKTVVSSLPIVQPLPVKATRLEQTQRSDSLPSPILLANLVAAPLPDLPLAGKQAVVGEMARHELAGMADSASLPTLAAKPPAWMREQTRKQAAPANVSDNIDHLVDKVEQQLFHRLTIQRERRGNI